MEGRNKILGWATMVGALLLLFANCASAIDLKSAKDQKCFPIDKTVQIDLPWMMSVKTWYYPLMHRYDLFNTAIEVSGKNANELSEDEVYYDSCMTFDLVGKDFFGRGFNNGRSAKYDMTPTSTTFETYKFTTKSGYDGSCYITLTDNKTFFFTPCCITDDQMIWGIGSSVPELPKKTVKLILEHAESLGFKRETFTRLRYDSCKADGRKDEL